MRYLVCTATSIAFGQYWKPPAPKSFSTSSATRPAPKKPTARAAFCTRPAQRTGALCSISIRPTTHPARSHPTPPARCRRRRTGGRCASGPAKRSAGISTSVLQSCPAWRRAANGTSRRVLWRGRSAGRNSAAARRKNARTNAGGPEGTPAWKATLQWSLRQVSLQIAQRIADHAQAGAPRERFGDLGQHLFVNADEQGRDLD